jgi:hypothetical protein
VDVGFRFATELMLVACLIHNGHNILWMRRYITIALCRMIQFDHGKTLMENGILPGKHTSKTTTTTSKTTTSMQNFIGY